MLATLEVGDGGGDEDLQKKIKYETLHCNYERTAKDKNRSD